MVTKWYADRVNTFVTIADVVHPPKYTQKMEVYVAGLERPTHEVTAIKKNDNSNNNKNKTSSSSTTTTIIIIKRISRASIYCTRWEHRALYNNTNNTHTHTHTRARARARVHTHTHIHALDEGIGTAVKNSLEIIIK